MSENSLKLPRKTEGSTCCIKVDTLKQYGLLTSDDIKNPKYKKDSEEDDEKFENFDGNVIITFTKININMNILMLLAQLSASSFFV